MSAPIRYTLKHPLTFTFRGPDGERQEMITELELRRIKGKDMRGMPTNEIDQGLHLIGKISGLTPMQVDELDAEDINDLGQVIEGFLPPGLRTGSESSAT